MTKFAVATVKQATDLKYVDAGGADGLREPMALEFNKHRGWSNHETNMVIEFSDRGWIKYTPKSPHHDNSGYILTDAGRLALELREALGPDRNLSVAGAKAILRDNGTRATRTRLMEDGLRKRSFVIGQESTLTEDGERIKAILIKYRAEF